MKLLQKIRNRFSNNNLDTMKKGTVKFYNSTRGFGFITSEDSSEDIFVHMSGLIDTIRENDNVRFETAQGQKGLNADQVQLVG